MRRLGRACRTSRMRCTVCAGAGNRRSRRDPGLVTGVEVATSSCHSRRGMAGSCVQ